jgi:cytochrome c1
MKQKLEIRNNKMIRLLFYSSFLISVFLYLSVCLLSPVFASEGARLPHVKIDSSGYAIKRGEEIFKTVCNVCHGLKYLGYKAQMDPMAAKTAFGIEPPDLSLIAKARGKRDEGAVYIYALLTSYNDTPTKNTVFPNIAMPPVLLRDDPEFEQKAKDIAAFLLYAAEPTAAERRHLGKYVLAYMVILTALLYALNKKTWKGIKKKA